MPRITFRWPESRFSTDCIRIADIFAGSPEAFQPRSSRRITASVREGLRTILERYASQDPARRRSASVTVNDVEITVADHPHQPPR